METKNEFLEYLHKTFTQKNQQIGNYFFVKWLNNGNFQCKINEKQNKSIKPELLILAFETYKQKPEIKIDYKWLKSQGHNNWCTPILLKNLFEMYENTLNNKSI